MAQIQQTFEEQPKHILTAQILPKQQQIPIASHQPKIHEARIQKKLIVSDLNLNNPQDRALSLCLKMLQMRKKREMKQVKLLQQIRRSRVMQNRSLEIGDTSRVIEKRNSILRNQYLRQKFYRIAKPKAIGKTQKILPIISQQQRKAVFQRELLILQKSKKLTQRHEIKKMITDIFDGVVDKIVKTVQRKKRFFFGTLPGKISDDLERNWSRVAQYRKSNDRLRVSRVLDMKMEGKSSQQSQHSDNNGQQANQNEQNQSQKSLNDNSQQQSSIISSKNQDQIQNQSQKSQLTPQPPQQDQQPEVSSQQSIQNEP